MKNKHLHHLWLIVAAYGVWFAVLSGIEEAISGKYWKMTSSLVLGIATYLIIEKYIEKK